MPDSITQIGSGINALMHEFDVVAHNIANVSTVGYKRRCSLFSKSMEQQQAGTSSELYNSLNSECVLDFSQGNLVETGRPLDFALYGKGFFVLETPEGPLYTRNGVFHLNPTGQMVNSDGKIVAGEVGPIIIPPNVSQSELFVSADGSISAGNLALGRFRLVNFDDNEDKLTPVGGNSYSMPDKDVEPTGAEGLLVKQGFQEASNVKMIDELVGMLLVSRLYEANVKLLSARKESSNSIINVAMG
jgi:flagellar basal-body rod protein FlgF